MLYSVCLRGVDVCFAYDGPSFVLKNIPENVSQIDNLKASTCVEKLMAVMLRNFTNPSIFCSFYCC